MEAKLSILGLYNYQNEVFDGLNVPDGLDRQTLIEYIMMECADLALLYPQMPLMQTLIAAWSKSRLHSWERLYQSTVQNYNMIHNYDRYEDWTDSGTKTGSRTENTTGVENITANGNSSASGSTGETTETSKPGYNVATDPVTTEIVERAGTAENYGNSHSSGKTSKEEQGDTQEEEQTSGKHSGHLYGNIGTVTAAAMLTAERELYKWDVYGAIAQEFKERFCVMVY